MPSCTSPASVTIKSFFRPLWAIEKHRSREASDPTNVTGARSGMSPERTFEMAITIS